MDSKIVTITSNKIINRALSKAWAKKREPNPRDYEISISCNREEPWTSSLGDLMKYTPGSFV